MNSIASPNSMPTMAPPGGPYPMGLMGVLATVSMLFAAFTAALLVRRTGVDWTPVPLPNLVYLNTAVLMISGVPLELGRRAVTRGRARPERWIALAAGCGVLFLVGQLAVWRILVANGVFLPSNPHASFIYMLSGVHAAHVIGGLAALAWTTVRAARGAYTRAAHAGLVHAAIYWHFMAAVWLYVLLLLSVL